MSTDAPEPCALLALPNSVLTTIAFYIVGIANPGQVVKLALTCRALYKSLTEAEGLWEALCVRQGWSKAPRPPPPGQLPVARELALRWHDFYSRRMGCRRNVRRFMKLYIPFLSRASSMALLPGALPEELAACERRLRVALPWELWELYRFRSGQAPGGLWEVDMRLLGLDEVTLERHPSLPDLERRLEAMGAPRPQQLQRPGEKASREGAAAATPSSAAASGVSVPVPAGEAAVPGAVASSPGAAEREQESGAGGEAEGGGQQGERGHGGGAGRGGGGGMNGAAAEQAAEGAAEGDERMLVVATNSSCSRRLMVAMSGRVFLARGLSLALAAPSVSKYLQKLLT
ncbi:hypothetical protein HYH03_003168 [Edaphochlamys debaryana]|uniref:F-box domain-containing protein n=1 Tax=Edaphochlamys debaryana TaxID=47281 RepID=A0A835YDQ7_9CHLO|nr:hypothetical protein HYH03_003168 [Edaphochlamys debaryana]|eukprot:KAG2498981.1 hypothetical protein HYH03_003168 [Edaphochlamys debaryana]